MRETMPRPPWWIAPIAILATLSLLPSMSAATNPLRSGSATAASVRAPLLGTVVRCTSTVKCLYNLTTRLGSGWANSTLSATSKEVMALKLPGESKVSSNLSYATYTQHVTYAYPNTTTWTVGTFLGTDLISGHIIYGVTDTNFTATCHPVFRWCHYTYTTDNGTIIVRFTNAEVTSTAISCTPTSTKPGGKVSCSVDVTNGWNASKTPTGAVNISDGSTGTLSDKGVCKLTNGSCSFVYRPADNTCGGVTISASYRGTAAFYKSAGSATVDVIVSGGC